MTPLLTDSQFNSLALIVVATITVVPALLAAYWARTANTNSVEAKKSAAAAAHEVTTNGGMSHPNPNLNDHVMYQTEMLEKLVGLPDRVDEIENKFDEHVRYANYMGQGMAEMYLRVMGEHPPTLEQREDS